VGRVSLGRNQVLGPGAVDISFSFILFFSVLFSLFIFNLKFEFKSCGEFVLKF
jgi:hypothetical protein